MTKGLAPSDQSLVIFIVYCSNFLSSLFPTLLKFLIVFFTFLISYFYNVLCGIFSGFFSSVHEKTLLGNAFFYDNTFSFTSLSFLLGYFTL